MTKRTDDFPPWVKLKLANQVNGHCSRCRVATRGPHSSDDAKDVNLGVAAHICAASEGGARYDARQSSKQRQAPANGIHLCSNCASHVDRDLVEFTVERLHALKKEAMKRARAELGTRSPLDPRAELLGRLEAIPAGTQVRLSYIPEGKQSCHDQFTVEAIGVDRAANVYRFKKGDLRDHLDSAPLNDVEDSWIGPDGTPFISLSGCMVPPDKNPFHPFRYKSRPRGGART
jgi:hypothetical protein